MRDWYQLWPNRLEESRPYRSCWYCWDSRLLICLFSVCFILLLFISCALVICRRLSYRWILYLATGWSWQWTKVIHSLLFILRWLRRWNWGRKLLLFWSILNYHQMYHLHLECSGNGRRIRRKRDLLLVAWVVLMRWWRWCFVIVWEDPLWFCICLTTSTLYYIERLCLKLSRILKNNWAAIWK